MTKTAVARHLCYQYHLLRYRKLGITLELIEDELESNPDIRFNELFEELGNNPIFAAHNARFDLISDLCYTLSVPLEDLRSDNEASWYRDQADQLNVDISKIINNLPRR